MMPYGILADLTDDHLEIGESTFIKCVKPFAKAVVEVFGPQYLRSPNAQDTYKIL